MSCGEGEKKITSRRRTYAPDEVNVVPRWLRRTQWPGKFEACTRQTADLVAVAFYKYHPAWAGSRFWTMGRGSFVGIGVPMRRIGITAVYMSIDYPLAALRDRARSVIVEVQAPGTLPVCGSCSDGCLVSIALESEYGRKYSNTVCKRTLHILKGTVRLPVYQVSQSHLRHVTPEEVRRVVSAHPGRLARLAALNLIVEGWGDDLAESTFCTMALYLLLLPEDIYCMLRPARIWTSQLTPVEWIKSAKLVSVRLKSIQHSVMWDLTPLFEMDVLINRGYGTVDWEAEKANRTINIRTTNHTYTEIYRAAHSLFTTACNEGRLPRKIEWSDFWARRWEWAAAGAVHSQHREDQKYIHRERVKRTKWHTLSAMSTVGFDHWSSRKPATLAWPSTKYEWGKQRAIYGVDLTNYVLATYGFCGAEDVLPACCPLGSNVNEETIRKLVKTTVANKAPYCLDFDDFNSQHSTSSMRAVLDAYLAAFNRHLTQEQVEAGMWVSAALEDMRIMLGPNASEYYRARGTLLSGWRLTTFVNTVLNYIYVHIAAVGLDTPTLHSGDDVLVGVDTFAQSRAIEDRLRERGCRLQPSKCFLNGLCEFLRVDHSAGGGDGGQYLTRAVSTLTHAPIESGKPYMLRAVLLAAVTRWNEVRRRHADVPVLDSLQTVQLARIAGLWRKRPETLNEIIAAHKCVGGLSEAPDAAVNKQYIQIPLQRGGQAANASVAPGAYSYAWDLCHDLLVENEFRTVAAQANKALELVTGETTYDIAAQDLPKWLRYPEILRAKYGCKRASSGFASIKLLAGLGLPVRSLRNTTTEAVAYYLQYPASERLHWMAVTT